MGSQRGVLVSLSVGYFKQYCITHVLPSYSFISWFTHWFVHSLYQLSTNGQTHSSETQWWMKQVSGPRMLKVSWEMQTHHLWDHMVATALTGSDRRAPKACRGPPTPGPAEESWNEVGPGEKALLEGRASQPSLWRMSKSSPAEVFLMTVTSPSGTGEPQVTWSTWPFPKMVPPLQVGAGAVAWPVAITKQGWTDPSETLWKHLWLKPKRLRIASMGVTLGDYLLGRRTRGWF